MLILEASGRNVNGRDLEIFLLTQVRTKAVEDESWPSRKQHVVYKTISELCEGRIITIHFPEILVLSISFNPG